MIELEADIEREYNRARVLAGEVDPYSDRGCLGIHDVLRAHFLVANFFYLEGEGIGGIGPKDINLLHSAMGRQHTGIGNQYKWNDAFHICATLVFGLIKDHPFHDANKRTALLSCLFFLKRRGLVPTISKRELEDFMVKIASEDFEKSRRFKKLSDDNARNDAIVKHIAWFLKKNSRKEDKREYVITYRELAKILERFGYCLDSPNNNFINVCRVSKKVFSRKSKVTPVLQIGFPGMNREVNIKALKSVRKATKLDAAHGIDSEVFYRGVDDLQSLIAEYQGNLRSLAHR